MSTNTLILHVPSPLYDHLKQLAAQTQRSVEEETLEALATAVPQGTSLSAELQDAMASLVEQDDQTLVEAARSHLANDVSSGLLIRREIAMNLERKGTKSAKGEFSAVSASLRSYWYRLILPLLQAICLSSSCFPAADQES
jgi:hypothetical protein